MGKAREQEARLMSLGFALLALLAALLVIAGAMKIASEARSHSSGTPTVELLSGAQSR